MRRALPVLMARGERGTSLGAELARRANGGWVRALATTLLLGTPVLVAACAASPDDSGQAEDDLAAPSDARDLEADATSAARRADLARLLEAATGTADTDRDHDGIDDVTEEDLIRRYRPFYRFSTDDGHDEDRRPADPVEEMKNAQLRRFKDPGKGSTDPLPGCGRKGDAHLDPPAQLYSCEPDAALASSYTATDLCLNLADARSAGVPMDQAKREATGLSAHVQNDTVDGHPAYKIEYWQFFAFNNQDITVLGLGSYGDHEGDWTSVQVWFDRTEQRVAQLLYLIHGKSITFHVPKASAPTCRACTVDVHGSQYKPDLGNFFDDASRPAYDDNAAQFYVDRSGFKHVVVYVERGAHEFWPGPWGHAEIHAGPLTFHLNTHNGQGSAYLVPDVTSRPLNLGEVAAPLTEDARLMLAFDGHWGCTNDHSLGEPVRKSPVGPAAHCSWKWSGRGSVHHCEH